MTATTVSEINDADLRPGTVNCQKAGENLKLELSIS